MQILLLISLIVAAGLLGGAANYYMEQTTSVGLWKSILLGLTASATVPLLLNTMSSSLTTTCLTGGPAAYASYFVFFGFCTIAAIFSSKFLQTLGDKLIQDLKDVKQKQAELAETTGDIVDQLSDPPKPDASTTVPPKPEGDGDELESFKIGDSTSSSTSTPTTSSPEEKVMAAFLRSNRFAFRTVEGIAKDSGLDMGTVEEVLKSLEARNKAKSMNRPSDGTTIWRLK